MVNNLTITAQNVVRKLTELLIVEFLVLEQSSADQLQCVYQLRNCFGFGCSLS